MAKSKSGGSRAYIRGKLGADVYSIGKDGKGKKQQVVRSLAETVKNPQTINQMRGRMIMSTVMQAQSALSFIVDHSFDGVPAGQPSLSAFIRQNYALIKADVAAHPSDGNNFGLVKYKEKGIRAGCYVVSDGKAVLPANVTFTNELQEPKLAFEVGESGFTAEAFRSSLGLSVGDYFTLIVVTHDPNMVKAARLIVSDTLPGDTVITVANAANLFDIVTINYNSDEQLIFALSSGNTGLEVQPGTDTCRSAGVILSQQKAGTWEHNKCQLSLGGGKASYTEAVALPTYPVGEERFLNGGDL